jgi:hypothetical protein
VSQTPIHDQLVAEVAGRGAAATVREAFRLCDTCGAILDQPCRTASGGVARREHRGRGC